MGLRPFEERFRLRSSSFAGTRRPDKSLEVGGRRCAVGGLRLEAEDGG
jgi:hypothetical protein